MSGSDASPAARERLLVWGAGAIGGTVGAFALRAGHDVTLVDADAAHIEAIRRDGLRITGPLHTFTVRAPAFTPDQVEGRWTQALLCVKAHHTETAAGALAPHLDPDGFAVSMQNGLNERVLARVLGAERTVGAFVNFGADVLEPGVIHFAGRGAVVVGELDGRPSARLDRLLATLRTFEPEAQASDNIWGYLWGKMGYGAMLFASALTDDSIVDVLGDPAARPLLTVLAREVAAVTAAEGVTAMGFNGYHPPAFAPGVDDPAALDASFDAMVAFNRRSAKTHSGVWRDLAVHHRKTETDAQFTPILEAAARRGVAVPHLQRLVALMHEVEAGTRPRGPAALAAVMPGAARGELHAPQP